MATFMAVVSFLANMAQILQLFMGREVNPGNQKVIVMTQTRAIVTLLVFIIAFGSGAFAYFSKPSKLAWSWDSTRQMEIVDHQSFVNQRVSIDGKSFINCDFENITIAYNGVAPFSFRDNRFRGKIALYSENESITGIVALLNGFGSTNIPMLNLPPGTVIEPPRLMDKNEDKKTQSGNR